jgi:ATP-dependent RNA helicase RhlE
MPESHKKFSDFKLNKQLYSAIDDLGYDLPTPIQLKTIPLALSGHDIMGIAPTGTGKTAAFAIPIIMKTKYAQGIDPRVLVLGPTKELILQIEKNFKELSAYTDLRIVALYGGIGPTQQINAIQDGVDVLVSTPGRFLDLYSRGSIVLKSIKTMVLDEADKMMDMGFIHQIRKVLEVIPVKRQNLLFSATMAPRVVELSEEFLDFPEMVEVSPQATTAETIDQELYYLPNLKTKLSFLEWLLEKESLNRVMIFTKTRVNADNIFKYLSRKKIGEIRVIHANKGQNSRINAINDFKEGSVRVLVTTDVSSRGIDVTDVSHVINFDVPLIYEDYVHRIGRTGRAQKAGVSITFSNDAEKYHIKKIEELIRQEIPVKSLPKEVEVFKTPFEEKQEIDREIDFQKRKDDPDFKGAFHEKKRDFSNKKKRGGYKPVSAKSNKSRGRKRR